MEICCDTQAISELLVIMTKVNEVTSKINKLAPTFRSYRLDLATKNNNNSKETKVNLKNPEYIIKSTKNIFFAQMNRRK